ncbi:MAG: redoxin domain-containing protein [Ferruginibacter sp.]
MIKKLLFLCTFLVLITAAKSQTIAKWKIEDVVKSFSAKNDTVYVVNFWATFCKPCIAEIPDFIALVEKYKKQKVKLLLVSLDLATYYPAKIAAFAKKNNYNTNIVWLNETNADHFCPMIDAKWSGAIPSTIIVNNKTGYRKFFEDQVSPQAFETALQFAIGGNAFNKFAAPMNDAEMIEKAAGEYVSFKSNDSSVYSLMDGKVSKIARIENFKIVIIQKDNMFFTYSNLGSTTLKTGDLVKKDQLIGYATNELNGTKPTLDFYFSNDAENIALTKQNFFSRKDIKLTDHSIDMNNEPQ